VALTGNEHTSRPPCLRVGGFLERDMVNGKAGKGDKYRKVDNKKYAENWEKAFGKKKKDSKNGNGTNRRKNRGSSKRT